MNTRRKHAYISVNIQVCNRTRLVGGCSNSPPPFCLNTTITHDWKKYIRALYTPSQFDLALLLFPPLHISVFWISSFHLQTYSSLNNTYSFSYQYSVIYLCFIGILEINCWHCFGCVVDWPHQSNKSGTKTSSQYYNTPPEQNMSILHITIHTDTPVGNLTNQVHTTTHHGKTITRHAASGSC